MAVLHSLSCPFPEGCTCGASETNALEAKNANLRAWAAGDARKIERLKAMLVRADTALATCGVPKKSPVRININTCLKET